jgi:hypothetical protein
MKIKNIINFFGIMLSFGCIAGASAAANHANEAAFTTPPHTPVHTPREVRTPQAPKCSEIIKDRKEMQDALGEAIEQVNRERALVLANEIGAPNLAARIANFAREDVQTPRNNAPAARNLATLFNNAGEFPRIPAPWPNN